MHYRRILAGTLALAFLAAGCANKKQPAAGLVGGPGVTEKTITLGVLTDRTGAFAGAGKALEQGRLLFWKDRNAKGGVCGRQVEFLVKDHGYNAQQAVTAYAQVKDEVLALDELLGSPMIAALSPSLASDKMISLAASFSSSLLANPYIVISGSTYDIEMINGVHWLTQNKGLARGDKVGHIYIEGDYGENALAGSRAAAKEYGLQLIEQKVKATDNDLTAQITALRAAEVKFVLLTTTPTQTASAVGVAEAMGINATFLGSNPTFSGALLQTPAKAALENRLVVATSVAPYSSAASGPAEVRKAFIAAYPDQPKSIFIMYGYAQGQIMAQILEAACKNNDLTRDGLLKAFQSLKDVQTNGLVAELNYSSVGQIPARKVYVVRPDSKAEGGLTQVQDLFAAPLATTYQPAK
jgi:ABC-type branched-subunit amino acid transport system substrate-binding protein